MDSFPAALHVITYDMRGIVVETGKPKAYRQTGLVTHTHQLLTALTARFPDIRLAITQTGGPVDAVPYRMRTPDGHPAYAQAIHTGLPEFLAAPNGRGKDPELVQRYYEDEIGDPANPVYRALGHQYGRAVRRANSADVLLQNVNPLVAMLKAEELGYLDPSEVGRLRLTGVLHDPPGADRRLDYVRRRLPVTAHSVQLIAVTDAVRDRLLALGFPAQQITTVINGLDVDEFRARLAAARSTGVFDEIRRRNALPDGRMILMSARRVAAKGHLDLVAAMRLLAARRDTSDLYVVMTGSGMADTRDPGYGKRVIQAIAAAGQTGRIFLLDELTAEETTALFGAAHLAVLPSLVPEGFGYANIEAMLAGVPVITTRHGGPLDYIDHGKTGMFVTPGDPAALADAIRLLATEPLYYRRIKEAADEVAGRLTTGAMVDGYVAVLTSHETVGV